MCSGEGERGGKYEINILKASSHTVFFQLFIKITLTKKFIMRYLIINK